jgi:hypothetical protein
MLSITSTRGNDPSPIVIIKDDATPTQTMSHSVPPQRTCAQQRQTRAQHQMAHVHLINSAITEALMPLINFKHICKYPTHSYIATTQALFMQTYGINPSMASQPNTASINFIGAIVNDITSNVLEYQHLIKSNTHKDIWCHSFANKLGRIFQGIRDIKGINILHLHCKR